MALLPIGHASLDREFVDVGAQRVGSEMLLPKVRRKLGDATGGMFADPLQHINEISVPIDAVGSAGYNQTLDDADVLGAEFGPAE